MLIVLKLTVFILWVNFLPPVACLIFGERFNRPLDGNRMWLDNFPVFGAHKTIRGIVVSIVGGTIVFPLMEINWWIAGIASLLAMTGDLLSSFIKRRFNLPGGKNIAVLDQMFECLFPALFLYHSMQLAIWEVVLVHLYFIPVAYLGSCFWNFITFRTPLGNYPRVIRSTTRAKEWRSCHVPLARWQVFLNLSSFLCHDVLYNWIFKLTGLKERGMQNSLNVEVNEQAFCFATLPESFNNFRILLLADLHLDGLEGLTEKIISQIRNLEVDLCLIAGDIRMKTYGPIAPCLRHLRQLVPYLNSHQGILGVLGNHDCIEMTPDFEESGIVMLINDSWEITKNGESIWIVGVDDPHYYKMDDAKQAFCYVPENDFKIFLAHSPEAYKSAADYQTQLYLCGHTHGGQVCLPGKGPILTNSRAPRFTAKGKWQFQNMMGFTSRGIGASGFPVRFNCPGEINLITLFRGESSSNKALYC
jgi:hypothetical protein